MVDAKKIKATAVFMFHFVILMMCVGSLSCSKDQSDHGEKGSVQVFISVKTEGYASEPTTKSPFGSMSKTETSIKKLAFNRDFTLVASLQSAASIADTKGISNRHELPSSKPLLEGVTYRILIFDAQGKFVTSEDFIHGEESSQAAFVLDGGAYYTFVAYSYNDFSDIVDPIFTGNLADFSISSVDANAPFLLYKERLKLSSNQEQFLQISFKHQFSEITLVVESSAELGPIADLSATLHSHYSLVDIQIDPMLIEPVQGSKTSKDFSFTNFNLQAVVSEPLKIFHPETQEGLINVHHIKLITGETKSDFPLFDDIELSLGIQYILTLSLQPNGIMHNELIWARGNLAYEQGIYFNRLRPEDTGFQYGHTDYWNYASPETPLVPKMIVSDHAKSPAIQYPIQDPCRLIAGGQWRMPTLADYASLGAYKIVDKYGEDGGKFNGGQANGSSSGAAYIYFEGTNEVTGKSERIKFYKTGRLYGHMDGASHQSTHRYREKDASYMVIDAQQDVPAAYLDYGAYMPMIRHDARGDGVSTFLTDKKVDPVDHITAFTRDDRIPIRCVKDLN